MHLVFTLLKEAQTLTLWTLFSTPFCSFWAPLGREPQELVSLWFRARVAPLGPKGPHEPTFSTSFCNFFIFLLPTLLPTKFLSSRPSLLDLWFPEEMQPSGAGVWRGVWKGLPHWKTIFDPPCRGNYVPPSSFIHPPPLEGYFEGWGGWGV